MGPPRTPNPKFELKLPVLFLLENKLTCAFVYLPLWKLLEILRLMFWADWLVVEDGSLAVMLTESLNELIFSRSIPFGLFLVVVLHS